MAIALVVEDGSGLPNSNTYVASADADTYFANRQNAAWAALSADQKASALIQATQYLDARYTFIGQQLVVATNATSSGPPVLSLPTTAATGGTLAAGTWYYKASFTGPNGETLASNEVSQITTGSTSTVSFSIGAAPSTATGVNIYRGTKAGGETLLDTLTTTPTSYTDNGSKTPGTTLPQVTQALQWPRMPTVPQLTGIPGYIVPVYANQTDWRYNWPNKNLTQACCELAIRASTGALYVDETTQIVTSERVDMIAVTYAPRVKNGGQVRFAIVDDLLKPIIIGGQYTAQLLRA